jgi:lipopolysaccharide transport protein LptA
MLLELVQTGNFEFRTPQYQGRAQTGRFEEGGSVVTLEGSPFVSDSQKRLEAGRIRMNQKDNSFSATTKVSTLMKNPTEHILVKADRAEGGADAILYTGNVQLWRGEAYIRAERLNASGQNQEKGKVHAEAGPGGQVQSYLQNIHASSDTLDYDDTTGVIRYRGHVHAQKQDVVLDTPDLTANFDNRNLKDIVATGGVTATRPDQRGTGERAVYEAATDVVTLSGRNAQVRDKERGLLQGSTVVMKNKGQTVTVESGNGERTVTRHPVTNSKK